MKMYQNQTNWHSRQWILLGLSFVVLTCFTAFMNGHQASPNQIEQQMVLPLDTIPAPSKAPQISKKDAVAPVQKPQKNNVDGHVIKDKPSNSSSSNDVLTVVEVMPRFPGCEEVDDTRERVACAHQAMLTFIFKHLKYPEEAREHKIEGRVVVSFVIEKNGTVGDIKIVRDIGAGCGEESVRVMNQMNVEGIRWIPGRQDGQEVRVQFNLPIQFKLDDDKKN